jgi:ATP-dependent HslUV protease ATP-binding subunit HslU
MNSSNKLTPQETVSELNKFIVGQHEAKQAVAIAWRNRWRRQQLDDEMKREVVPHNILMIGPTGSGKTEVARRLADLSEAPFIKVEATKFTEVGYVGRDVDSIIRDLVENAIKMKRKQMAAAVREAAQKATDIQIVEVLVGKEARDETKAKFFDRYKAGELDESVVEISVIDHGNKASMPTMDIPGVPGGQMGMINLGELIGSSLGGEKRKNVKMTVAEARDYILEEETNKLIDEEKLIREAMSATEENGIVFLDEIDKIAARSDVKGEVNREGVQRDLLSIVEGTVVATKYGQVNTDHILFIASGAFHLAKPSDLLPELQGRLPIRVELQSLTLEDMVRILTEPKFSLTKQYVELFATEGVELSFADSGIRRIAEIATEVNREVENIGARRLHTILEKVLEAASFTASNTPGIKIEVDEKYVNEHLPESLLTNVDLAKFIL